MVSTRSRTTSASSPAAELPQKRAAASDASKRPAKKATTKAASELAVGKPVTKEVALVNQEEKEIVLADTFRDQGVVFFMYPRANTPGCTKQACGPSVRPWKDFHALFKPVKAHFLVVLSVLSLQASGTTSRPSRTRASRSTG